jgi:hypothetical protein
LEKKKKTLSQRNWASGVAQDENLKFKPQCSPPQKIISMSNKRRKKCRDTNISGEMSVQRKLGVKSQI